eukprot:scaffold2145_cov309-Prasinococcus_capsulatus_cf.AAC.1
MSSSSSSLANFTAMSSGRAAPAGMAEEGWDGGATPVAPRAASASTLSPPGMRMPRCRPSRARSGAEKVGCYALEDTMRNRTREGVSRGMAAHRLLSDPRRKCSPPSGGQKLGSFEGVTAPRLCVCPAARHTPDRSDAHAERASEGGSGGLP